MSEKLVEIIRSGLVESTHLGDIVVAARNGRILHKLGNPERLTFFHSSAKPLQGIAMLEAGIVEKYKLDLKDVALMISSHSGETEHIEQLKIIMDKIGVGEETLECGIAEPVNKEVLKEIFSAGLQISKLHCNCSGKHLGFIAASKAMGHPTEDYHRLEHPVQKAVKSVINDFSGAGEELISTGIDGCSVPVFAIPLKNMAFAYANLCDQGFRGGRYSKSQNYIVRAMALHPEMVAGKGRIDTELMKRHGSKVIGKSGAEGVYCAGLPGKGVGIAIKIEDGAQRAVGPVIMELLMQMGIIDREEAGIMEEFWKPSILNNKGEVTGEIRPALNIKAFVVDEYCC